MISSRPAAIRSTGAATPETRCEDQERPAPRLAIDQDAQDGEQVGATLDLVDDDQPVERLQRVSGWSSRCRSSGLSRSK